MAWNKHQGMIRHKCCFAYSHSKRSRLDFVSVERYDYGRCIICGRISKIDYAIEYKPLQERKPKALEKAKQKHEKLK